MTDHTLHPRAHLVRDRWVDLCGTWEFAFDDLDEGVAQRWFDNSPGTFHNTIQVPYPPESKLSGVHDQEYHPILWYRRGLAMPELAAGERLLLHFGAVDYLASVWLNGRHITDHEGGHTPFTADITDQLDTQRDEQSLVLRAVDRPTDMGQPRGKQSWHPEPAGIWYHRTSGIWQPVWLEPVPQVRISELICTPNLAMGAMDVDVTVVGEPRGETTLDLTVTLDGEVFAAQTMLLADPTARFTVTVPALQRDHITPLLWSPESPTLFDVNAALSSGDSLDQVRSYVGFRDVGVRDGSFVLNGRPYYLRMVLEQGYWPESHLAAPSADALRREVELVKELGFTGVRIHQKVEDPRFLYWCDRLGLLVWGEMANAHEFSTRAAERLTREWLDVVRRDRGHPCIVAWVPLNESWGVWHIAGSAQQQHYATALYHLTKAMDPSRPVISNDGWEHTVSDIWGIHDYSPTGALLRERYADEDAIRKTLAGPGPGGRKILLTDQQQSGQPIVITEFGGLSYVPPNGQKWFGYAVVESAEEFRRTFEDLVHVLIDAPGVAGFCYTQLTDTLQETNGLLTEDRTPKLPFHVIREIVSRPSRAVPRELVDEQRRRAEPNPEATE